ncbi:DegT/DnrJ/EryC1/StrS family aminotransferase [Stakelama saccharophila]|uniref:DegT/DnrJ/EryC1/StrS aminotransferase family protein n=1 Tax=Stakelama saccharophila TaxID=3075605 RepID=A0ABZ0BC33_9SPHN|nr:DegT/DnrJ/EryC1/StrS aminotransferase family protein [Stakelama sp. W311]WNO54221.1 DegT/DnrJ/EryC1/StrS aminotransferase family protein [Stakelama sp. W311]
MVTALSPHRGEVVRPESVPVTIVARQGAVEPVSLASRWPRFEQDEIDAATDTLRSGRVNSLLHGDQTHLFEQEFAAFTGVAHAIAVANGTLALELALRALGIGAGDEVIVPARSFFASTSAVVAVGASPVFADIDPVTQNICPESASRMIGSRTRAVLCVHLAGLPCDMKRLASLCEGAGLFLVEDCAQAHGAAIDGRRVGSFGHMAAFSFCTDKIMSTGGEGGMVTTNDHALWSRAWSYKDHGKDPDKLSAAGGGSGFRYVHDRFGSNFRLTEMQAAIGRRQLAKLPLWLQRRRANAEALRGSLLNHPATVIPPVPDGTEPAWYKCNIGLRPELLGRDRRVENVVEQLRARGITCGTGSCPDMSHEAAFAGRTVRRDGDLPVAKWLGERNLMVAVDHLFDPPDMIRIADAIRTALS